MKKFTDYRLDMHHRSTEYVAKFIKDRWTSADMFIDSSSFNFLVKDEIVATMPGMKFIRLIRPLPQWIESFLKMLSYYSNIFRQSQTTPPLWMSRYGCIYAPSFLWETVDSIAAGCLGPKELLLIDEFSNSWRNYNLKLFQDNDSVTYLDLCTSTLSASLPQLASFTQLPLSRLSLNTHVNKARVYGPYLPGSIYETLSAINDATFAEIAMPC